MSSGGRACHRLVSVAGRISAEALFGLSVLVSFLAFGIVAQLYILPRLRVMNQPASGRSWPRRLRFTISAGAAVYVASG
jgi:hypothetical protein